jgi:undecaprenyl-diphosphatase
MILLKAVLMGVLQGMTEFLPVSSSGHLAVVEELLGGTRPGISFEVFVHTGTLVAILYVYRRRIRLLVEALLHPRETRSTGDRRLIWMLLLASVPALVVALLWKNQFEDLFTNLDAVAGGLILTGLLLFSSRFGRTGTSSLVFRSALMIGCAQAAALVPGISRSGATISVALLLGMERERAAEFSFLLAVPAIAGATLWEVASLASSGGLSAGEFLFHLVGFTAAASSGLLAILFVLKSLRNRKFQHFAYYCWVLGIVVFILL